MARYKIITVVDITRSQPNKSELDKIKIGQQANFNSLIQAIGLRSNITWNQDPQQHTGRLPSPLEGKANHWIWEFDAEREDVFLKDGDSAGLLKEDLQGVPVINQLNNSIDLNPAIFKTIGDRINTHVIKLTD